MNAPLNIPRFLPHSLEEQASDLADLELTDTDIVGVFVENFGGTRSEAVERLAKIDFNALRAELL